MPFNTVKIFKSFQKNLRFFTKKSAILISIFLFDKRKRLDYLIFTNYQNIFTGGHVSITQ